jgi:hypothetical protein
LWLELGWSQAPLDLDRTDDWDIRRWPLSPALLREGRQTQSLSLATKLLGKKSMDDPALGRIERLLSPRAAPL